MPNGSDRRKKVDEARERRKLSRASLESERDKKVKEFNQAAHDVNNPNKTPEEHAAEMLRLRQEIRELNTLLRH